MNLVEMTEYLVKSLVSNKDSVTVKEFPSENENEIIIEVLVDETDMGKVIGKQGRIAKAIRTVVKAASFKDNTRVDVEIV